jgi:hypothetical protein
LGKEQKWGADMRKFVEWNNAQFNDLKRKLQDGLCHVFKNCELPACCSKRTCRIGFEKDNGAYTLLIDSGITCSKTKGGIQLAQFKQLLSAGELIFIDFNDLKVFLKSLGFLYE